MTKEQAAVLDKFVMYRSPALAFGVCFNVEPYSAEATMLLDIVEPLIDNCHMPSCKKPAVRVGVYGVMDAGKKDDSEFRGLCEAHKQTGVWNNDGGWSLS